MVKFTRVSHRPCPLSLMTYIHVVIFEPVLVLRTLVIGISIIQGAIRMKGLISYKWKEYNMLLFFNNTLVTFFSFSTSFKNQVLFHLIDNILISWILEFSVLMWGCHIWSFSLTGNPVRCLSWYIFRHFWALPKYFLM